MVLTFEGIKADKGVIYLLFNEEAKDASREIEAQTFLFGQDDTVKHLTCDERNRALIGIMKRDDIYPLEQKLA